MDTKNLKKLRIYIVDDHKLFREGLKLLLSTQDFVHHIYEASNGRDFIENLSFVDCDLVLMDIEMPEMNGIEATEQALRIRPDLKVIVLSMYGDEQYGRCRSKGVRSQKFRYRKSDCGNPGCRRR